MDERPRASTIGEGELQRLNVPTLVLTGEYDSQPRRSIARHLARTLPDARLQTMTGAGHLAALDDPAMYSQALHHFFSSHLRGAANGQSGCDRRQPAQGCLHEDDGTGVA
jgi:pimeloyl-ACP methyl ester carboxylesterase